MNQKQLASPVITPVFEDWSAGRYKIVSFYAKRARGLMVRWAALNGVTDPQDFETLLIWKAMPSMPMSRLRIAG